MPDRPYTLLSCSMSIDGYIAGAASRLLLSNGDDFDRVDDVRASCDAILVGAATVRIDNPRLLVRSELRRERRAARGLPPSPAKVTTLMPSPISNEESTRPTSSPAPRCRPSRSCAAFGFVPAPTSTSSAPSTSPCAIVTFLSNGSI